VHVATGPRAGFEFLIGSTDDGIIFPGSLSALPHEPGDAVVVDNGAWLAYQYYHRCAASRRAAFIGGLPYTGRYEGKVILIQGTHDHCVTTLGADQYAQQVSDCDRFRIWWVDNADHGPPLTPRLCARLIDLWPTRMQALRDMIAWVEAGAEPPRSTNYTRSSDGVLTLEPRPAERGGIQPVVALTVNGSSSAQVLVGEPVNLDGLAEVPPGAGSITQIDWDPEGGGDWPISEAHEAGPLVNTSHEYVFTEPGTYFPGMRASAQRDGNERDWSTSIENIARARVVVRSG
jgi:hypothetical protein